MLIKSGAVLGVYRSARKTHKRLNSRLLDSFICLDHILDAASRLGLMRGSDLSCRTPLEALALLDYALLDHRRCGRNVIDQFLDSVETKSALEKRVATSLRTATTSLYAVEAASPLTGVITLTDLLYNRPRVMLVDINYSKTARHDHLVFTRLVPIQRINMTSGISMVFRRADLIKLMRAATSLMRRLPGDKADRRFAAFFSLYRTMGLSTVHS